MTPVVFFVHLPNADKGMTGAEMGNRVVVEAIETAAPTHVVRIHPRRIRVAGTRVTLQEILAYLHDYRSSLAALTTQISALNGQPFTLYLYAASSLLGSLRDMIALGLVRRRHPEARIVLQTRNGDFFYPKGPLLTALRRWQLARAARIICLSHRLLPDAKTLARILPLAQQDRIKVVPNTIDADLIAPPEDLAAKARRTGAQTRPIHVLYLSNFIPSKGYQKLGEAIRLIAEAGRLQDFHFTFRGTWPSPELRAQFEASFAPQLLASGAVNIGEALWDRDAVRAAYLEADVFCLPTSYPAEAQPRSILEAMACGCAILANDHASIADMVEHGANGALLKDITPQDMADVLLGLDRETLLRQGATARVMFDARFSPEAHNQRIREAVL
ncbi:glycosyltransferase family 4 protein [Roseobacteraceae bacterium S113]